VLTKQNNAIVKSKTKLEKKQIRENYMKLRTILLTIISVLICQHIFGQDIHFSNYNYSPLYLSPAKTGEFQGTYRFGVNARTQFNTFIVKPYRTIMGYIDGNIGGGLEDHHWFGVGLNIYSDSSGDLAYRNNGIHLSGAYHYALDKKYNTVITLGGQFGITQRNINDENYQSTETLQGNADSDLDLLQDFNPTIFDVNVGLSLKKKTSKTNYLDIGVAVNHLSQSDFFFTNSQVANTVAIRVNAYGEYYFQTSKQLAFRPTVVYSRMFNFQNLFGQFNLEYKPNKKSPTIIKGGLGLRTGDALQFLAGMFYKDWDVGIAYDLTISTAARFTNRFGGLEIGIKKILIKNTKPKAPPVILCPHF